MFAIFPLFEFRTISLVKRLDSGALGWRHPRCYQTFDRNVQVLQWGLLLARQKACTTKNRIFDQRVFWMYFENRYLHILRLDEIIIRIPTEWVRTTTRSPSARSNWIPSRTRRNTRRSLTTPSPSTNIHKHSSLTTLSSGSR
jgi:hypothetical protein